MDNCKYPQLLSCNNCIEVETCQLPCKVVITPLKEYRVISLWQPWASLIAFGEKNLETRSKKCSFKNYRGEVLIHAAKHIDIEACKEKHIRDALARHGVTVPSELPTGCIIAKTDIVERGMVAINHEPINKSALIQFMVSEAIVVHTNEYHFGDYSEDRTILKLKDTVKLKDAIQARGMQGLWRIKLENVE